MMEQETGNEQANKVHRTIGMDVNVVTELHVAQMDKGGQVLAKTK